MATYKTPGVYIEEISLFPPSVAEVETAIPAFIGYTEKATWKGKDLTNVPKKVTSLLEFEEYFGTGASPSAITVTLDANNTPTGASITPRYHLYPSLQLFYDNGGGDCYIVSVGGYGAGGVDVAELRDGLDALEKYDEPTIILFPDAVLLEDATLYDLQAAALDQCERLQDRVAVFDLLEAKSSDPTFDWSAGIAEFRNNIGVNALRYGAAYTPHLETRIPISFDYSEVSFEKAGVAVNLRDLSSDPNPVLDLEAATADLGHIDAFIADPLDDGNTMLEGYEALAASGDEAEVSARIGFFQDVIKKVLDAGDAASLTSLLSTTTNVDPTKQTSARVALENYINGKLRTHTQDLLRAQLDFYDAPADRDDTTDPRSWAAGQPGGLAADVIDPTDADYPSGYDLGTVVASATPGASIYGDQGADLAGIVAASRAGFRSIFEALSKEIQGLRAEVNAIVSTLEGELETTNVIYANAVEEIERAGSTLPPSGAVAGVYAKVDRTRGVWKSPANVSLALVNTPTVIIDDAGQESLNVDAVAGKSINAIRTFVGRGTLVWGARTLAGNDNEWRYVSVRRFFNTVEESVKKSTSWAVFEPNDAKLWTKIKGMVDNYLIQKWQEGALAGAKPDEAFFVEVGLGLTMTAQDILEGRLIVKVGMAVVRPAEFIIFQFSHKLQES